MNVYNCKTAHALRTTPFEMFVLASVFIFFGGDSLPFRITLGRLISSNMLRGNIMQKDTDADLYLFILLSGLGKARGLFQRQFSTE